MIQIFWLFKIPVNIHLKWLIEEYAINFRSDVWFNPLILLIIQEMIIVKIKNLKFIQYDKRTIGAIFCHVINNKLLIHVSPSITIGNQKWNGAIPTFIIKQELKIIFIVVLNFKKFFKDNIEKKIIKNNKILEAKAWVKKYFNIDSDEYKLLTFIIRGINDNKLISNPIQILNQEDEQILIKVPKNNIIKNNIL